MGWLGFGTCGIGTRIRRGRSDDREEDKKEMNGGKIKGGRKGEGGGKEEREHGPIKAI